MTDSSFTMRIILVVLICAVLPSALAAVADEKEATGIAAILGFEQFPRESTCEGADLSPRIEIQGCNASSLALILEDPDAPSGTFIHWIIWNIPPNNIIPSAIPREATLSDPLHCRQGYNDFGEIGYAGPCPPSGKPHRYFFRVFCLDRMLDLPAGASAEKLREAMQGHIVQQGQAMARFGR
jgi:Raf kinase inhibitor-like YbhB/YbcL family protein